MSWKDYFYFSKTERNGITVVIVLIVAIILYPFILQKYTPEKSYDFSEFEQKLTRYEEMLAEYKAAKEHIDEAKTSKSPTFKETRVQLTPFLFNPNELTKEEFMELGLSERIATNILNYRNAGGQFRFKEDFQRIYSINEALYAQLESYIDLPLRSSSVPDKTGASSGSSTREVASSLVDEVTERFRYADVRININNADTTEWQKIRGIGPVFSKRITSYRDLLGGFYSLDQLLEVYGMDTTRYQQMAEHIFLDTINLQTININTADFVTLVRHPYLERNQVNSILQMRQRHGPYSSVEDIKRSELIDEELFNKIAPYLSINDSLPEIVNREEQ